MSRDLGGRDSICIPDIYSEKNSWKHLRQILIMQQHRKIALVFLAEPRFAPGFCFCFCEKTSREPDESLIIFLKKFLVYFSEQTFRQRIWNYKSKKAGHIIVDFRFCRCTLTDKKLQSLSIMYLTPMISRDFTRFFVSWQNLEACGTLITIIYVAVLSN